MLTNEEIKKLEVLSLENRNNILDMVYTAQSGHIGGSLSSSDILTVLFHKCMNFRPDMTDEEFKQRDRFILSKGHISPLYYSVLSQLGFFPKEELSSFRKLGTRLQGHPTPFAPGVEMASGSLGQGLSYACGIAMALKLDKNPAKVFVLMGDGELQEGNIWEALMQASHRKLNNLIAIVDRNRLQIDGNTENVMALGNVSEKFKAFGWNVAEIDGHNFEQIYNAIEKAKTSEIPAIIVANTIKGKGVDFMENNADWHGKAPKEEDYLRAKQELA